MHLPVRTLSLLLLSAATATAQGTASDYARAQSLAKRTQHRIFRDQVEPHWLPDGLRCWYRVSTGPQTAEFIVADLEKGQRHPAFDHAKLAAALTNALKKPCHPDNLPFQWIFPDPDAAHIHFRVEGRAWTFDNSTGKLAGAETLPENVQTPPKPASERRSKNGGPGTQITFENRTAAPVRLFWLDADGARREYATIAPGAAFQQSTYAGHVWLALTENGAELGAYEATASASTVLLKSENRRPPQPRQRSNRKPDAPAPHQEAPWRLAIKEHNIRAVEKSGGAEFSLTSDGFEQNAYRQPFLWSPNAGKLAALRVEPGESRQVTLVESSPADQVQPKLKFISYPKPGDKIDHPRIVLFDAATRQQIPVNDALFPTPWSLGDFRWSADGKTFYFLYNQRGHQVLRLLALDAATGQVRTLAEEQFPTFVDYTNKIWHRLVEQQNDLLWMSERDGWNHLYRFDAATGQLKNRITRGEWVVKRVERVDVERQQIWFAACGIRPKQDPYYEHLCRVNFDGGSLVILTEGDGTHQWEFSPDGRFFIDRWSRVDQPTVTEIRRSDTGGLACLLERGDASALTATGWQMPQRFVAKGRDGKTDIHGIITRPTQFDPARKYPVIEKIYAGPQDFFVPKSFGLRSHDAELAELGFILVQIDGMGTNWRSKAFHDVCAKNLQDAGFPDRIAWMKTAAAQYPEMDLSRVGIYGGSAGGQNALGALLFHGDFYDAAVADCGCHDNRMDKIWWNEQWMGWPVGKQYEAASNVANAHRLKGRLLLTWGEMDTNVDPSSSMQVVHALIRADKDFEMLVVPGAGHGVGESPYLHRRRMDFFVRHLLEAAPSARN
ncbi:MAG: prolyl oligopeptidase family serine peptidase [Verrucomicrobiales bacterium]|nr:prolyl oligopeptidase family serine peptidase [Verrucomicrobiales bacterium]